MKIIRNAAFAVALVLAGAGFHATCAQDGPSADALQAARELVALVTKDTVHELAARITAQVWPQIEAALKVKQTITSDQLAGLRREFLAIQVDFATKIMADAPVIYARHFTVAELHELIAFYRTPVGAKAMRIMPQITAEALKVVMSRLPQLQTDAMEAFSKILKQRGFNI